MLPMKIDKTGLGGASGEILARLEDFRDVDAEGVCDPLDYQDGGVTFSILDAAQVGLMNISTMGKFLL